MCLFPCQRTYNYVDQTQSSMYERILTRGMRRCVKRHAECDKYVNAEDWKGVIRCRRANIMYDRHLVLMPTYSGMEELSPEVRALGKSKAWADGLTTRKRGDCEYPLPQTIPHYTTHARHRVKNIKVRLCVPAYLRASQPPAHCAAVVGSLAHCACPRRPDRQPRRLLRLGQGPTLPWGPPPPSLSK